MLTSECEKGDYFGRRMLGEMRLAVWTCWTCLQGGVWQRYSRQREIKRQLKENFSDLCFCLMSWPVLSFGGWFEIFEGDWIGRRKDSATLNKEYTRKLQDFLNSKEYGRCWLQRQYFICLQYSWRSTTCQKPVCFIAWKFLVGTPLYQISHCKSLLRYIYLRSCVAP